MVFKALLLAQCALAASAFVVPTPVRTTASQLSMVQQNLNDLDDRRSFLQNLVTLTTAAASTGTLTLLPQVSLAADEAPAAAPSKPKKVVVMGGAGYVGSRVTTLLADQGYSVVSVSRSSAEDQAAKIKANTGKAPSSVTYESLDATKDDLSAVLKDATTVVSCVGIVPWEKSTARAGNGLANIRIADAAKAAGVDTMVYVSVATEFANGPGKFLFSEYFKGKAEAEATVTKDFPGNKAVLVKPGFIEGAPPGEVRPPGPPGLAAVSADAVARAVVAGVLGQASGSLDGYDAIMAVAKERAG